MARVEIPHITAPGFASLVATAASIVGPTSDGMMHILFWRDGFTEMKETAESVGGEDQSILNASVEFTGKLAREDVAKISLTIDGLKSLLSALQKHVAGAVTPGEATTPKVA